MISTIVVACLTFIQAHPELLLATAAFLYIPYLQKKITKVPFNWPIVGRLPYLLANVHRLHDLCAGVLRATGGTFLFKVPICGEEVVLTSDPANVNHVFNVNFGNYPKGGDYGDIFEILGDGIFNSDHETWKMQRNVAHGLVSASRFKAFVAESSREKVERDLLPLLDHVCCHKEVVDLQDIFMRFTFDSTSLLVFGIDPGCLSLGFPTVPFAKAIDDMEEVLIFRHVVPKRWWKLLSWLKIGAEKKMAVAREVIEESIASYILIRRKEKEKNAKISNDRLETGGVDLLTSYLDNDDGGNDKFLRDTALTFIIAGRDTTSAALSWFFWLVSRNPNVEEKILEELNSCMALRPQKDDTSNVVFEAEEVEKLVYLHASLCESLRLYPPVPFEHKGVLNPDTLPSGTKVHSKTRLLVSLYSMGRMASVWGNDCRQFRPERWISEHDTIRHEPSYKFLTFNAGPRSCLGKNIAFTQMKVVVAAMLYNYQVEVLEEQIIEPKISIILHMKNGMMVRVKRRIATSY